MVCRSMAKRYVEPPTWWESPPPVQPPPKLRQPDCPCYEDKSSGSSRLCVRCQEDKAEEDRTAAEEDAKSAAKKKDKKSTKDKLRERLLKRSKTQR